MGISLFNVKHDEEVHSPLLVVHGESTLAKTGSITVSHRFNAFPPLHYEVNSSKFKILIHLDPGSNDLLLTHNSNRVVNGYLEQSKPQFNPTTVALTIHYVPLVQNKPIHLCLLLGKDSPALFDTTSDKSKKEGNGLDLAIRKLRIGGRLMQSFTNEQMKRAGFGNRTFNFVEEFTKDTQFLQEEGQNKSRNTIKIHVLRSKKTVAELRDANLAQQNPKGTNTGGLFGIAMDALADYGGPFAPLNHPVQAAVMFIDTHWDKKLNLILTHAALGGGDNRYKLAIFGSHGIYSWPSTFEQIVPAFQDTTRSNINEVANDANQCGSYWECLNITLGAFMHEIGHLLGCPHQVSGVMLRDYVTLNRSFLTRETACLRTNTNGYEPVLPKDECTWHRLDLLRFLYHPSFGLPSDYSDPGFKKQLTYASGKPVLLPLGNGGQALLKSNTGIYAIEIYKGDLAHGHIEYLPKSLGGEGAQTEVVVDVESLRYRLPNDKQQGDFDVLVLAIGGEQSEFKQFAKIVADPSNVIHSDFGLGRGPFIGLKSGVLGDSNRGAKQPLCIFDPRKVVNIRVYWGSALDGVRIDSGTFTQSDSVPPIPQRDYKSNPFSSILKGFKDLNVSSSASATEVRVSESALFGKQTGNFTDFPLYPGESIDHFNLRSGAWVDAIQIVTNTGRTSPLFGNQNGGGQGTLSVPQGFEIIGLHGSVGSWIDSIGIVYVAH